MPAAMDEHLAPLLPGISAGRPVTSAEFDALAEAARDDPVQSAFSGTAGAGLLRDLTAERIVLMRVLCEPFTAWWRGYFPGSDGAGPPVSDLWRLYLPLAQWIVRARREQRPGQLFMMGFNGSPGAGKTVLTSAIAVVLNRMLDPEADGRAVARSGDDWYLGKKAREALVPQGYDPGVPGVSNRALPGTHDLRWLKRNLREMERSTRLGTIRMGSFDKRADDQPPGQFFDVRGKVGVFLFDLWFAGARTDVDPMELPDGLRRRVAEKLRDWRPVFDRMDALWSFDWPSFEQMVRERERQERLAELRSRTAGMNREQIRAFMSYMIEQPWDWRVTSPVPPDSAVTFRAWRDENHRVIAARQGGRAPCPPSP